LDIPRVLIPPAPGILCAIGLLVADPRVDFSRTRVLPATASSLPAAAALLSELEAQATAWFDREGTAPDARRLRRAVDMRYAGQNYELTIDLTPGDLQLALDDILAAFHAAHDQAYGFASPGEPAQFVTFRLEASASVAQVALPEIPPATGPVESARSGSRRTFLPEADGWLDCPVYDRALLGPGHTLHGPAVIEQMDTTTLVLPGQVAEVDKWGNVVVGEGERGVG
jgi:N-methylhydantoinase A